MQIKTKAQLREYLREEKQIYAPPGTYWERLITHDVALQLYKFVRLLRKTEYHHNRSAEGNPLSRIIHKVQYALCRRRKNILGIRLGIEMKDNSFDKGLTIHHAGNIVVNGYARIGKNCWLHGSNCIGNDGKTLDCPVIGDNVHIGVGAKVIGNIRIADNINIAAGAVVVTSFTEPGITVAGIPARRVR